MVTQLASHIKNMHSVQKMKSGHAKLKKVIINGYEKWMRSIDSGGIVERTVDRNLVFIENLYSLDLRNLDA